MENKKEEVIEKTIVTETESPQPSSSAETTKESAAASEDRQQRVVARNSIEAELMSESRGRFHALSYVGQTPLSLSYSVVHISPITILLSVNVSTEATVWCGAWPLGEEMNLKLLQASTPGVVVSGRCLFCHSSFGTHHITSSLITSLITHHSSHHTSHHSSLITHHSSLITSLTHSGSRYYPISSLTPSTTYDVTCFGYAGTTFMTENPFSLRQSIMTKEKVFAIKKARFSRDTIEVFVDSNLEISVLCFLFNGKNIKIDNKLFDPNQDASVVFDVPKRNVQYRVQCSALNDSSKGWGLLG